MTREELEACDERRSSVLSGLSEGSEDSAFPRLLQGRVYADFRRSERYFETALGLVLSLYGTGPKDPVAIEMRSLLEGGLKPAAG